MSGHEFNYFSYFSRVSPLSARRVDSLRLLFSVLARTGRKREIRFEGVKGRAKGKEGVKGCKGKDYARLCLAFK